MATLTNFLIILTVISFSIALFPPQVGTSPIFSQAQNNTANIRAATTGIQDQLTVLNRDGVISPSGIVSILVLPQQITTLFTGVLLLLPTSLINSFAIPVVGPMIAAVVLIVLLVTLISWFFGRQET